LLHRVRSDRPASHLVSFYRVGRHAVVLGETAALGQHSREILAELGDSESEIARFYESAVVA
jgi:hypothetical protein